jgi:hypothetical protein
MVWKRQCLRTWQWRCGNTVPLRLYLGIRGRWMIHFVLRLQHIPWKNILYPVERRLGGPETEKIMAPPLAFRQSRYSISYFLCLFQKTCSLKAIPASTELLANQTSVMLYTDLKLFHKQMSKRRLSFIVKLSNSITDSWPRVNQRASVSYCIHVFSLSLRFYFLKPCQGLSAAIKRSDRYPFPHK